MSRNMARRFPANGRPWAVGIGEEATRRVSHSPHAFGSSSVNGRRTPSVYPTSGEVHVPTGGRDARAGRTALDCATGALPLSMTMVSPA